MSEPWDVVVSALALNGGKLVGKTRLQKTVYLLDACGMNSEFDYEYHNFGPFSAELAQAADDAKALGLLSTEEHAGYHSVPYVIFATDETAPAQLGDLTAEEAKSILGTLAQHSALDLEIAATLHFLKENGYRENADEEVVRRKPLKATPERLMKSRLLLTELGLD